MRAMRDLSEKVSELIMTIHKSYRKFALRNFERLATVHFIGHKSYLRQLLLLTRPPEGGWLSQAI